MNSPRIPAGDRDRHGAIRGRLARRDALRVSLPRDRGGRARFAALGAVPGARARGGGAGRDLGKERGACVGARLRSGPAHAYRGRTGSAARRARDARHPRRDESAWAVRVQPRRARAPGADFGRRDRQAPPRFRRRRKPARGGLRDQRRAGVEPESHPRCRRSVLERRFHPALGRRRSARGRLLDGCRRVRLGALATGDVRTPDRAGAGRARRISRRRGRGTGFDLRCARDESRGRPRARGAYDRRSAPGARHPRARGARPQSRGARLALGRGTIVVLLVCRGRAGTAAPVPARARRKGAHRGRHGDRRGPLRGGCDDQPVHGPQRGARRLAHARDRRWTQDSSFTAWPGFFCCTSLRGS